MKSSSNKIQSTTPVRFLFLFECTNIITPFRGHETAIAPKHTIQNLGVTYAGVGVIKETRNSYKKT